MQLKHLFVYLFAAQYNIQSVSVKTQHMKVDTAEVKFLIRLLDLNIEY